MLNPKRTLSVCLIMFTVVALIPVCPAKANPTNGPGYDNMIMDISFGTATEYLKLKSGNVDVVDFQLDSTQIADWRTDPSLAGVTVDELGMTEFDLNHMAWPTSDLHFRRAVAYLVDKEKIIKNVLSGLGQRLDVPLPPALRAYIDPDVVYPNYPYEYSKDSAQLARAELEAMGFTFDTNGKINNWGTNPPVRFVTAGWDPDRTSASWMLNNELKRLGIPILYIVAPSQSVSDPMIMVQRNFNIYSGHWSLSREPWYLRSMYNGQFNYPGGPNYPGFNNPDFNFWSDQIAAAPDLASAVVAVRQAQDILVDQVAVIPLWSYKSVVAYRKGLAGMVSAEGKGPNSWDTWFQSYKTQEYFTRGGGAPANTIVYGFSGDITGLNPVTSTSFWDWEVLNEIYEPLLHGDPYNLALDTNWHTESFQVGTWTMPDSSLATKITYILKDNLAWHDGTSVTGDDVQFSLLYYKQQEANFWAETMHIDHVDISPAAWGDTKNRKIEIYMDILSIWALHWTGYVPTLPKHIWEDVEDAYQYEPIAEGTVIGYGPWKFLSRVAGVYVTLVANRGYDYAPSTVTAIDQESFHRCGDMNYDWKVEDLDHATLCRYFSATPYLPAPTYTVPPGSTVFGDQMGLIPATKAFTNANGFAAPDLNYDGKIYVEDLATYGRYMGRTAE